MAKMKFDGLIEAARFGADGNIEMVRAYERRGATFSDHILISRENLVVRLKKGEKFVTGQRKEFLASTFETTKVVRLEGNFITTGGSTTHDKLDEVPFL